MGRNYFGKLGARALLAVLFAFILTFFYSSINFAAEPTVLREAFPNWVIELPIPKNRQERGKQASGGVYDLLQDTQIKLGSTQEFTFRRSVQEITGRSGMEDAARLQIEFDPATDDIVLHRAAIWREGKLIDQSAMVRAEIMRRESKLEKDIITNYRTADFRLQDVRVGDLVDFAWAWRTKKSYWPGHHFSKHSLGWSVPVGLTQVRLVKPDSMTLYSKVSKSAVKPVLLKQANEEILTWTVVDSDPLTSEKYTPAWNDPWAQLELSTMRGWDEVAAWARPFYKVDQSLPAALHDRIDAIVAASQDRNVRITEALRLVQDNVRYTSIPIMSGGYAPRLPKQTWDSGFGDCKDKTALLIAVLARLNISAEPALTDVDEGYGLKSALPSANLFDHVIVKVNGLAKPLWLDPTGSHEGGIVPHIADLTYGYALPLNAAQAKLEPIVAPVPGKPTIDIVEEHAVRTNGVQIEIQNIYRDDEADIIRRYRAERSTAEIDQQDLEYFGGIYLGLEQVGDTIVRDDRNRNELYIKQSYFLPATADIYEDTVLAYQVNAWTMAELYPSPKVTKRHSDIELPSQINRRHIFRIVAPTRIGLPTDEKVLGDAFTFERKSYRHSSAGVIEFKIKGNASIIPPEKADAYRKDAQRLDDLRYEFIDLTDEFGGYAELFVFALLIYVVGGLTLLFIRVKQVKAEEASGAASGVLCPVGLLKFCVLAISTSGIYSVFWFWRCWRQLWHCEAVQIQPFWRAFFGGFWSFALFDAARDRADYKMASWVGATVMIVYLLSGALGLFAERDDAPVIVAIGVSLLSTVILLPLIRQVNLANSPLLIAEFSKIQPVHFLVVALSLPFTISIWFAS